MSAGSSSLRIAPPSGGSVTAFPWREAMQFGLGVLRLPPASFWAMTPRELASAFEAVGGGRVAAPERRRLETLMAAFPDKETSGG